MEYTDIYGYQIWRDIHEQNIDLQYVHRNNVIRIRTATRKNTITFRIYFNDNRVGIFRYDVKSIQFHILPY